MQPLAAPGSIRTCNSEDSDLASVTRTETAPGWQLRRADGHHVLALAGDWVAQSGHIPEFPANGLADVTDGQPLAFDTAGLGHWDTGLIAFLWDAKRAAVSTGIAVDSDTLPDSARKLLGLLPDRLAEPPPPPRWHFRPLYWLGGRTIGLLTELGTLSTLLAATMQGGVLALFGRTRIRGVDLLANIRAAAVGTDHRQRGQFPDRRHPGLRRRGCSFAVSAADVYVANLVGLAVVREMAAVMTAIVMAGRTGGAYAARIATMQGNEEIDALQVIGIPVSDYILLPAVLALAFTMPFLYLYGCVVGMLGGLVVSTAMLNVTGLGYLYQTMGAVPFNHSCSASSKASPSPC